MKTLPYPFANDQYDGADTLGGHPYPVVNYKEKA